MAKQKKFTTLNEIEQDLQSQTRDLYQQTPSLMPTPPPPATLEEAIRSVLASQQIQPVRRRQPQSIIPRQNGKLLFLEVRHNEAIEQIHWTSKVDRQDVIRTAVDDFLNRYFRGDRLTEEGEQLVRQYYARTHK